MNLTFTAFIIIPDKIFYNALKNRYQISEADW